MSRRAAGVLAALSAAALALAWLWASAAPYGGWEDQVFGVRLWNHSDPAGYYLPSAHELFAFRGRLLYPGHPGLPMQLLLRAVQSAYFHLAAPSGEGFSAFTARRIVSVFFFSKLAVALVHVSSFWAAFLFARGLLGRERAALLAAAGYATSLPVVYYSARISAEPFMMTAFFLAFAATWECGESLEKKRSGRALAAAALAGIASVAGLASKFHLAWPLPFLCALNLVFGESVPLAGRFPRGRGRALAVFAAAAAGTVALSCLVLDWRDFFAYWDVGGMSGGALSGARGLAARQLGVLAAAARGVASFPLSAWLPAPTRSGLFWLCEDAFLLAAAGGAVLEARRRGAPRGRWLWVVLGAAYSVAIWSYRTFAVARDFHGFHYLFVLVGVAAVLFGRAADAALDRWGPRSSSGRAAAAAAGLALVHQPVLWAAASAIAFDAASYARVRALGAALAATRGEERAAVVTSARVSPAGAFGLGVLRLDAPNRSALIETLAEDFAVGPERDLSRARGRPIGAATEVVVEGGAPRVAGPYAPAEWKARRN